MVRTESAYGPIASEAMLGLIGLILIVGAAAAGVAVGAVGQALFDRPAQLSAKPATAKAKTPFAPAEDLTPPPFVLHARTPGQYAQAVKCLAEAVYYEAGFEPLPGQQAVAPEVLNRMRDSNFPATVCGVVYQGERRRTGCQFSFACDGSRVRRPPALAQWNEARIVAEQALSGYVMAAVGTATHYHTTAVSPWWKPTVTKVAQVGSQIFYRWPGKAGLPTALKDRYAGVERP